jgi:glycosyltransferase involved in cell wall biosynthesis
VRIVIDAASASVGGAVTYLKGLLPWLGDAMPGHDWIVLVSPEVAKQIDIRSRSITLLYVSDGDGPLKRIWRRQVTLRRLLKALRADALYSSANFAMFWCPVRQVLLVRNAIYFDDRYLTLCLSRHSRRRKAEYRFRRWLIHAGIAHADVVMTPTEALMLEVRRLAPPRPRAILVANPYGVDSPEESGAQAPGTKAGGQTGIVRLLYVSLYADYKNLRTLLQALPIMNDGPEGEAFHLTTTADPNPRRQPGAQHEPEGTSGRREDRELLQWPEIRNRVRFTGPLSPEDALDLYEHCDIFVFPSFCESFGHPLAEAMARGLPIVAAGTPVNREMCQEAAVYFDPLDPNDLARQVRQVASDEGLRANMRAAGLLRAQETFSWHLHVRRLANCLAGSRQPYIGPERWSMLQRRSVHGPC